MNLGLFSYKEVFKMFREQVEETNYTKSFRDEYVADILESIPDPIVDEGREKLL